MESIDKLREWSCRTDLHEIADEIEAEIAERFIELPTDADGVPWTLETESFVDDTGRKVKFSGLQVDRKGRWEIINVCVCHDPSLCSHIKQDPLKELLNEYVDEMICIDRNVKTACERLDEETNCTEVFVKRIRELLGGDA